MASLEDRFIGSMLGLALGDALGAPFEGGGLGWFLRKAARGKTSRTLEWTDDTQMAMGLAQSLTERGRLDCDHLAERWAKLVDPERGYGRGALKLLEMIRGGADWREANRTVFPDGSYGNGAAMRAAPLGLFFHRDGEALARAAEKAASITHAHPLGIEGGVIIARAAALALGAPLEPDAFLAEIESTCRAKEYVRRTASARLCLDENPPMNRLRALLGNGVLAIQSVITALYVFCRHPDDFEAMMKTTIDIGGDTDTIGAMAGAIFGARNGCAGLPAKVLDSLEAREELKALGRALFEQRASAGG